MKKFWTLVASTMMLASVSFAQDDYDSEYEDQAEEQYTEQEQAEVQADEQQQAEEAEQPAAAEEPAPTKPAPAPVQSQASVQETAPADTQDDYAQEPASRQVNRFGAGLRVAFDYGRMYGFKEDLDNDSDISGTPSGFGFDAGLMLRIQMIPNLYFTPEVNVAYISTNHKYMDSERKYNSMDLEIPLMMRGIVADRFYIAGGAQITLSMSSEAEIEPITTKLGGGVNITAETEEHIEQTGFGLGIVAGAGFNIYEGLFLDLRYYMGITELYPDVKTLDDMDVAEGDYSMIDMSGARMMKFKVGISYWFF